MTHSRSHGAGHVRLRLAAATVAAVATLVAVLPVTSADRSPAQCASLLGLSTPCGASGQNLTVVLAFAAGGLVWWLTGSRRLPPLRRR